MTIPTYSSFSCYKSQSHHASEHTDARLVIRQCVDGLHSVEDETAKAIWGALSRGRKEGETCKGQRCVILIIYFLNSLSIHDIP